MIKLRTFIAVLIVVSIIAFVCGYYWEEPRPSQIIVKETVFPKGEEYIHTSSSAREELIPYKNKFILVIQCQEKLRYVETRPTFREWTIVSGYILKYRYTQTKEGLDVSEVTIIPVKDREEISRIVKKHKFQGHINFW